MFFIEFWMAKRTPDAASSNHFWVQISSSLNEFKFEQVRVKTISNKFKFELVQTSSNQFELETVLNSDQFKLQLVRTLNGLSLNWFEIEVIWTGLYLN